MVHHQIYAILYSAPLNGAPCVGAWVSDEVDVGRSRARSPCVVRCCIQQDDEKRMVAGIRSIGASPATHFVQLFVCY